MNSPSTSETASREAFSTADEMFGTITRSITVPQPAPRLRAASVRVGTSIACRPASSDRYMYGNTRTT